MRFKRQSGILLHPTSLPSRHGIGDLGEAAYTFIDFLRESKQSLWQVLPLGPTGYADSPYQCHSAFAGNAMLINLDKLVEKNLLQPADVEPLSEFSTHPHNNPISYVDYGRVIAYKQSRLHRAHQNFSAKHPDYSKFEAFVTEEADWLEDYALFRAIKQNFNEDAWWKQWTPELIQRDPKAIEQAKKDYAQTIDYHRFIQWLFFEQWTALKNYANERGIRIMGDIPIYVAHDSADVWANQALFYLNTQTGDAELVAGVPPDFFSSTGQYWGNPLYRWDEMKKDNYAWWAKRLVGTLKLVDILRVDHFRGFEAYWEIPVNPEQSAQNGQWVKGPDADFFEEMLAQLGELPLIAEDLGVITPEVNALRRRFELPGMRILQFAFDGEERFLPHNFEDPNTVVYTGTHDNETVVGWFGRTRPLNPSETVAKLKHERDLARAYMNIPDEVQNDAHWHFIRLAWASIADIAIIPFQDALGLDNRARMNRPGEPSGWWQWRCHADDFTYDLAHKLAHLTKLYQRATF